VSKTWLYEVLARYKADVRVVDDQGELIGRCTIDPARGYQPLQKALVSAMS
jgi:hypothetical protein